MKVQPLKAMAVLALGLGATASVNAQQYGEALQKSLLFYEAQQAGPLPDWNRVEWRGDSVPDDGADVGLDLRGGWFDAGDHVKFGFPMAATTTLLAWGGVDYRQAYEQSGQMEHLLNNLRFVNDYFINAHPSPNVLYGQVGLGNQDHSFWGPAEVVHHKIPESRVAMKIDMDCPGPDLAAETAAAMASSAMVFEPEDSTYAATLLDHARELYDFAENTTGEDGTDNAYSNCITDAQQFYNSTYGVYWDEMAWGAVWLWRATGEEQYRERALYYYDLMGFENRTETPVYTWSLNWNDKAYAVYVLMADLIGDERFHTDAQRYLDHWSIGDGTRTPGGIAVVDSSGWGVNRYAANLAFLSLRYADVIGPDHHLYDRYQNFGKQQIDYILGDNPLNLSYLIGYGDDYPTNVHHRGSHGSWADSLEVPEQQRHELIGAVVAGPDNDTNYTEDRGDYVMNEVAVDYNSGFTGAVAALYDDYGGEPLPESEFPPTVTPEPNELLVGAQVNSSGPRHIEIKAVLQNRTTTPADGRDDLYFRYFYDLSEVYAAGYTADDVTLSTAYSQATSVTGLHPWGDPADNIYYAEISFAGDVIFPGGQSAHRREVQFRASLPTTTDAAEWDNSNDPSWDPVYETTSEQYGATAPQIAIYGDEGLLWGEEPGGGCGGDTGVNCAPTAADVSVTTDYEMPVAITLEGNDSDGSITGYQIVSVPNNGTLSGSGSSRTYSPAMGFSGSDSFTYTVTDDAGAESGEATVTISVEEPAFPNIAIDAPVDGAELNPGQNFTLEVSLSNAASIAVMVDGNAAGEFGPGETISLTAPARVGAFDVSVTAQDANGNALDATDSATYYVVTAPVNTPPEACFTYSPSSPESGETITFDGSCSSDADGDELFYSWDFNSDYLMAGEVVENSLTVTGETPITLTVNDGTDSDSVTQVITIEDPSTGGDSQCEFVIQNEWNSGYIGLIRITNNGDSALNGWQVGWEFTDGSTLQNSWNATISGSNPYSAEPLSWNSTVQPDQTVEFGFQVSKGQPNAVVPTLTGTTCD